MKWVYKFKIWEKILIQLQLFELKYTRKWELMVWLFVNLILFLTNVYINI